MKLAKNLKLKLSLATCLTSFIVVILSTPVSAATEGNVTTSPAELNFEISERQPKQVKQVTITNNYAFPVTMNAELRSIDENSGLLLPAGPLSGDISKAIQLSETLFRIPPKSNKVLTINATNVASLGPGGHYISLVLSQLPGDGQQVSLRSAASINIFFIKTDGARQSVKLDKLELSNWLFNIAAKGHVTLTNDGNMRITPRGAIFIQKGNGDVVAKGIINTGSQPLMPGKSFGNTVQLTTLERIWLPQKLYVNITYRPDDLDASVVSKSFWYIPPFYLLIATALTVALFITYKLLRKKRAKKNPKKSANASQAKDMPKILKIAIRLHGEEPTQIEVKKRKR